MSKRRTTAEAMFKLVSEMESGGYDRHSFARLHGLSVSKLDYWRDRYRRQQDGGFTELRSGDMEGAFEILYPNGVTLRFRTQVDRLVLRQLLTLL